MTDVAGKCKKRERNKVTCTRYHTEGRQERNAFLKLFRHVRRHVKHAINDSTITVSTLPDTLRIYVEKLRKDTTVVVLRDAERISGWSLV